MEKRGDAKPGMTRCDKCPDFAAKFLDLGAFCLDCYNMLMQDRKEEFVKKGEALGYPIKILEEYEKSLEK